MRVLITRPYQDSMEFASLLKKHGIESHINPLLEIEQYPFQYTFKNAQALIITSLNGIRCFAAQNLTRDLPLFVVGEESKKLASWFNFKEIIPGRGSANSLVPLIQERCPNKEREIVYITGEIIHSDLTIPLSLNGYHVKRMIVYQTVECKALSSQTLEMFEEKRISAVTFFSPRSAQIFAKLIDNKKILCQFLYSICLSSEIAEYTSHLPWKELKIAPSPSRYEIVNMLEDLKKRGAYE